MKGPKFNARVSQLNHQTDQNLARVMATFRSNITDEKYRMMDMVLRSHLHAMNWFQEENAPIENVFRAVSSVTAQMTLEAIARTNPKSIPQSALAEIVRTAIADFTDDLVAATNQYFGTEFTSTAPQREHPPVPTSPIIT